MWLNHLKRISYTEVIKNVGAGVGQGGGSRALYYGTGDTDQRLDMLCRLYYRTGDTDQRLDMLCRQTWKQDTHRYKITIFFLKIFFKV